MGSRLLLVDDTAMMRKMIAANLQQEGYEVQTACDGHEGLEKAREWSPELIVTDFEMPGLDGPGLCQALKADGDLRAIPVIMLTSLGATESKVLGLDSGADDYVAKPFHSEELLARVRALLRRTQPAEHLRFGELRMEPSSRQAWRSERALELTSTEFDLLEHLMRHPRQVLSREQLLDAVWKGEAETDNVVAVYVGYLRQKLGQPRLVHTVRGAGYALRE